MNKRLFWIFSGVALVLFLFFSFFDLPFSRAVYAPSLPFAQVLALAGDAPIYIFLSFLGFGYFFCLEGKKVRYLGFLLVTLGTGFGTYMFFDHVIEEKLSLPILAAPLVLTECALGFLIAFLLRKKMGKEALSVLFALTAALALSLLLTHFGKPFFGRLRFREMLEMGSFDGYTPWWVPHLRADGEIYKSFPSGHTNAAAASFFLWWLPALCPSFSQTGKAFLYVTPPLCTLAVAASRVLVGAHFVTDTLAGMLISLFSFYLADKIRQKILQKRKGASRS